MTALRPPAAGTAGEAAEAWAWWIEHVCPDVTADQAGHARALAEIGYPDHGFMELVLRRYRRRRGGRDPAAAITDVPLPDFPAEPPPGGSAGGLRAHQEGRQDPCSS